MLQINRFIATFAYLGFFPFAAGSIASLAGLLMAYFLRGSLVEYVAVLVVVTVLGFMCSGSVEKAVGVKDPACVVIDEVSGALLAFFLLPLTPGVMLTTFFLFRAFDMFKIYPAYKWEALPGASGIMLDDIVAGIFTNIVMQIAVRSIGLV